MTKEEKSTGVKLFNYITIFIALTSLAISYFSYSTAEESLQLSQKELVRVELDNSNIGKVKLIETFEGTYEIRYFKCIINNIGNRPFSIVDYTAKSELGDSVISDNDKYNSDRLSFSDITDNLYAKDEKFGVYNSNLDEIRLPIKLGIGESRIIYLKIPVPSSLARYNLGETKFAYGEEYNSREISNYIFEQEIDSVLSDIDSDPSKEMTINNLSDTVSIQIFKEFIKKSIELGYRDPNLLISVTFMTGSGKNHITEKALYY